MEPNASRDSDEALVFPAPAPAERLDSFGNKGAHGVANTDNPCVKQNPHDTANSNGSDTTTDADTYEWKDEGSEEWDFLGDGYYSAQERIELVPLVRQDRHDIEALRAMLKNEEAVIKWHTGKPPKVLGQGTFGRVYEAIDDETGEIIAVKEVGRSRAPKAKSIAALQQEMYTLRLLRHQNIVQYKGVQHENDNIFFLMEYCPKGCISNVLKEFGALEDSVVRKYTSQILTGLDYLHRLCIVHRDVKCANCLLSVGGMVKLADFGASKHLRECNGSIEGTALYMAPEVLKGRRVGRQADIWAVGCCVIEMFDHNMPFDGHFSNDFALMYRLSKVQAPPKAPANLEEDAKSFIDTTFTFVPEKRPSARWFLDNHPFVRGQYPEPCTPAWTPSVGTGAGAESGHSSHVQGLRTPGSQQVDMDELKWGGGSRPALSRAQSRTIPNVGSQGSSSQSSDTVSELPNREDYPASSPITHGDQHGSLSSVPEEFASLLTATREFDEYPDNDPNGGPMRGSGKRLVDKRASFQEVKMCAREGALFEKFCHRHVEAAFERYYCARLVRQVRTSKLVMGLGFALFVLEELLTRLVGGGGTFFDQARLMARCTLWALIFAVRFFPLPNDERTYPVVRRLCLASGVMACVSSWNQKESTSMIRMLLLTCVGCMLLHVKSHLQLVSLYTAIRFVNFLCDTYTFMSDWTGMEGQDESQCENGVCPTPDAAAAAATTAAVVAAATAAKVGGHSVKWLALLEMRLTAGIAHLVTAAGSIFAVVKVQKEARLKFALAIEAGIIVVEGSSTPHSPRAESVSMGGGGGGGSRRAISPRGRLHTPHARAQTSEPMPPDPFDPANPANNPELSPHNSSASSTQSTVHCATPSAASRPCKNSWRQSS